MLVNSLRTLALIDSGAGRSCLSLKFAERLKVKIKPFTNAHSMRLSAADGHPLICVGTVDLTLTIQGLKIPQTFSVVKGLSYNLLLGVDFMHHTHAFVDFGNKTLSVCDDLVVEHLVSNKTPTNVIKTTSKLTIPALSEAIIPVISSTARDGSFLLEPLPLLYHKNVSLARAVVSISDQKTQCRIMNPTNASVLLPKHTALATVSPMPNHNVFEYEKSTTESTIPLVDYYTQLQTLKNLGIEVDATHYTQSQKENLITLLYNNRDLFTSDICKLPGTDLVSHHIDTGSATPIRQRPYRHSPEARKELDRQIDRLLEADIIEESDSPWGSPVVLVKKKNNTHRLCVDMRKVNSVTKPIFFPLPLLEEVLQTVAENNPSTYSVLDLTSGFWQIKLDESSKPKTAFVTHRGNYQFKDYRLVSRALPQRTKVS